MMKDNLIILLILLQAGCTTKVHIQGTYYNTKSYIDAPINVLALEKGWQFSLIYPNVIGEKQIGTWVINEDTLVLTVRYVLKDNFKDTLISNPNSTYSYLIRRKTLRSLNNNWILKKE